MSIQITNQAPPVRRKAKVQDDEDTANIVSLGKKMTSDHKLSSHLQRAAYLRSIVTVIVKTSPYGNVNGMQFSAVSTILPLHDNLHADS